MAVISRYLFPPSRSGFRWRITVAVETVGGGQPCPVLLPQRLPLLWQRRAQEVLPTPLHREPTHIKARGPMHKAPLLLMERQPPFVENGCDPAARPRDGGQAVCPPEEVVRIAGDPGPCPQPLGQSIAGDMRPPGAVHAALGRPFRRVVPRATCPSPDTQERLSGTGTFLLASYLSVTRDARCR
jgi:hypothetical protein